MTPLNAQNSQVKGQIQDFNNEAVLFANIALFNSLDSNLVKVETTDDAGVFNIDGLKAGNYYLKASYVGLEDLFLSNIQLDENEKEDVGILRFSSDGLGLDEVTVSTSRAIVEMKSDRTVFNVNGTINSAGEDALSLMRKAPSVSVDKDNNILVLGRSGVQIFIDGKVLPLSDDDLTAYLQSLSAEQIDRMDIITNPSAKYEAQGNAGIIDIRLKRNENNGMNGSLNGSFSQARQGSYNLSGSLNFRNKKVNIFGSFGYGDRNYFNDMNFRNFQNNFLLDEVNQALFSLINLNYRFGTDFFVGKKHTIGILVGGTFARRDNKNENIIKISNLPFLNEVDSVLVTRNSSIGDRDNLTLNLNYKYDISRTKRLNLDLDFGQYNRKFTRISPNYYFDRVNQGNLLSARTNLITPETTIDIYTAKVDYEQLVASGDLGIGVKLSRVVSGNSFLFYEVINNNLIRTDERSNTFDYAEDVIAGYLSYKYPFNSKWNASAGLRFEHTSATGLLIPFGQSLGGSPVLQNYLSTFPSVGITWTPSEINSYNLAFGRRINRPDYKFLNPIENNLSELSILKGNPNLLPEIINNLEIGWTFKKRYNLKLGYSQTTNLIARIIVPDENNDIGNSITWRNLAEQNVLSGNIAAPIQFGEKWNGFFNLSAYYIDSQADFGNDQIVDVQIFNYRLFTQHTFSLPGKLKGEASMYFSGPGVWGGLFRYESSWSFGLGVQRKFLNDKINIKISASDIFYQLPWRGVSEIGGLQTEGSGEFDSRKLAISIGYNFGNQKVKSRKRKTGLEEVSKRVGN